MLRAIVLLCTEQSIICKYVVGYDDSAHSLRCVNCCRLVGWLVSCCSFEISFWKRQENEGRDGCVCVDEEVMIGTVSVFFC